MPVPQQKLSFSRLKTSVVAALLAVFGLLGLATPALAEDPTRIPPGTFVIDTAGVLGNDATSLTNDVRKLQADHGATVFIVFVDHFTNPTNPQQWAAQVANLKNMGTNDSILAVAVKDRQYSFDAADDGPYESAQQAIANQYIAPKLSRDDWAGAAAGAIEGVRDAASGNLSSGGGGGGGGSLSPILIGGIVVIAIVGGLFFFSKLSRKRAAGRGPDAQQPQDPRDTMPIPELRTRAGSQLVAADDAIKVAEQEIGFAEASYGAEAVTVYQQDLDTAKEHMQASFQLQHQLDDHIPDTEEDQRSWLKEIIDRSEQVVSSLQNHEAEFSKLRDLESTAPQALQRVKDITAELPAERSQAETTLAQLEARYSEAALANAQDSLDHANDLLQFVQSKTAAAEQALSANDRSQAVWSIREAENTSQQLKEIFTGIQTLPQDLQQAERLLQTEITESRQHLSEAHEFAQRGQTDPALPGLVRELQTTLQTVESALPSNNPVQHLAELEERDNAVDHALGPLRDQHHRAVQAEREFDGAVARAQANIQSADEFIRHRRGTVAHQARSELSRAQASLAAALQLRATDPVAAVAEAKNASSQARKAQSIAERDYDDFSGSGRGRRDSDMSAVIGGLILGQMLGGGRGHSSSSGSSGGFFGGGGSGGSFGGGGFGGGFGGGSFGGGGSGGSF